MNTVLTGTERESLRPERRPPTRTTASGSSTAPTTPRRRRTTTRTRTRTKRKPPQRRPRRPRRPRPPRPRAVTPPAAPVRPVARRAAPLVVRPAAMAARLRLRLHPLPTPRPRLTIRSARNHPAISNKAPEQLIKLPGGLVSLKRPDGRSLYRQTKKGGAPTNVDTPYKPLCQRARCRAHDPHAYLRELLSLLISASRRSPSSAVWAITKIVSLPASEPSTSGSSAASTAAAMPEAVPG